MDTTLFMQQLQDGAFGGDADVKQYSIYDTQLVINAAVTQRYFTNQLGSPLGAGVKTLADTNMTTAGVMPQGQHFSAMAIQVMYTTAAAKATADVQSLYTFMNETTVELIRASKYTMWQGKLGELMGDALKFAMVPTVAGDNIPLNQPRFTGIYPLNEPIVFPALIGIEAEVTNHVVPAAALADDKLCISLQGLLIQAK
jgi:hypothetical protein